MRPGESAEVCGQYAVCFNSGTISCNIRTILHRFKQSASKVGQFDTNSAIFRQYTVIVTVYCNTRTIYRSTQTLYCKGRTIWRNMHAICCNEYTTLAVWNWVSLACLCSVLCRFLESISNGDLPRN